MQIERYLELKQKGLISLVSLPDQPGRVFSRTPQFDSGTGEEISPMYEEITPDVVAGYQDIVAGHQRFANQLNAFLVDYAAFIASPVEASAEVEADIRDKFGIIAQAVEVVEPEPEILEQP